MIEIIPRPIKKSPPAQLIFFYLSFFFFLFVFLSYLWLFSSQERIKNEIEKAENLLLQRVSSQIPLAEELSQTEKKLEDFNIILGLHPFPSKFFNFLEESSHPQIFFSKLDLDVKKQKATLSGQIENFVILGQQIEIFSQRPEIEKIELTKVFLEEKQGPNFTLDLFFKPDFFK